MRLVPVAAVGPARADHADWRLLRQHGSHLHRASMRAQQLALAVGTGREEKRVVHLAGRMPLGKVQLGEIQVITFDIRPFRHRETKVRENGGQFVNHLADRVDAAHIQRAVAHGERDIHRFRREAGVKRRGAQRLFLLAKRCLNTVTQRIERLSRRLALIRLHLAERGKKARNRAGFAQRCDTHGFQPRFVGGSRHTGHEIGFDLAEIRHRGFPGICVAFDHDAPGRQGPSALLQQMHLTGRTTYSDMKNTIHIPEPRFVP
jgi:hypothetical protein